MKQSLSFNRTPHLINSAKIKVKLKTEATTCLPHCVYFSSQLPFIHLFKANEYTYRGGAGSPVSNIFQQESPLTRTSLLLKKKVFPSSVSSLFRKGSVCWKANQRSLKLPLIVKNGKETNKCIHLP